MRASFLIPIFAAALTMAVMGFQSVTPESTLAEAPEVKLPQMAGFSAFDGEITEAELTTLPKDTVVHRKIYENSDRGVKYNVSAVVSGRSKSSLHRPELCLPSQGYSMMTPHTLKVSNCDWREIRLERGVSQRAIFAYTFYNQEGYSTSSHTKRILHDVLIRSIYNRIDRWVMITVCAEQEEDESAFADFITRLKEEMQ